MRGIYPKRLPRRFIYLFFSETQVVVKVFERVVYDQLYHYLTENRILSRYQSGFRSLHSTCILIRPVREKCQLKRRSQFKLQAFDKYVHSNEGMA